MILFLVVSAIVLFALWAMVAFAVTDMVMARDYGSALMFGLCFGGMALALTVAPIVAWVFA